ncbi:hypothetical protein PMAYCL1PPCAC_21844, partial [Pristionchus mayeri]
IQLIGAVCIAADSSKCGCASPTPPLVSSVEGDSALTDRSNPCTQWNHKLHMKYSKCTGTQCDTLGAISPIGVTIKCL